MRILVSAGGTGGHIYPALALIDKFKSHDKKLEVIYVGTHNRMEKDIVPALNIEYYPIEIYGLTKNIIRDIKDVYLIIKDKRKLKKLMMEFKPDVVLGIGGYVTYPVIKAAHELNIPIFIHEQNSIPGKVNRVVAKYADLIGVSFKSSMKYFEGKNVFYSGNPTGERATLLGKANKKDLGLSPKKKLVTIVGGSLGSSTLNAKLKDYLKLIKDKDYEVLYITGKNLYDSFKNEKYSSNIKILPYYEDLPKVLKCSDLIITRAGASTIAEIKALNIPAIFIPSPYVAYNHQYFNALELKEEGCAEVLEEDKLNPYILEKLVDSMLKSPNSYITNLKKSSNINAGEVIYQKIKELLDNE